MIHTSKLSWDGTTRTYLAFSSDLGKENAAFRTSLKKKFSDGIMVIGKDNKKCYYVLTDTDVEKGEIISWTFSTDCKHAKDTKLRIFNS
jgi:hypothetical protein